MRAATRRPPARSISPPGGCSPTTWWAGWPWGDRGRSSCARLFRTRARCTWCSTSAGISSRCAARRPAGSAGERLDAAGEGVEAAAELVELRGGVGEPAALGADEAGVRSDRLVDAAQAAFELAVEL